MSKAAQGSHPLALVTGASAGIGEAFARRLARDGYDLRLGARRRDRLETLAAELSAAHGIDAEVLVADLSSHADQRVVCDAVTRGPALDLLINNAGFGTGGPYASLPAERELEEIEVNVVALARLARAVLPAMIERKRGGIINVSSMAGFQATPFYATYGATKAFVLHFSEALHEELRGTGVQVLALCPGFTRTEFQGVAKIEPKGLPEFAWMDAPTVVDQALAALRAGSAVYVNGVLNQVTTVAIRAIPRSLVRRLSGMLGHSVTRTK